MVDESCGYCWYRTEVVACATLCTTLTSRHFSALEFILRCIISSGNGCERHYATFRLNPFCLNLTFFSVATLNPVVLPWQGQDKAWITEEVGMGSAGKSLWNVANGKQKKKIAQSSCQWAGDGFLLACRNDCGFLLAWLFLVQLLCFLMKEKREATHECRNY